MALGHVECQRGHAGGTLLQRTIQVRREDYSRASTRSRSSKQRNNLAHQATWKTLRGHMDTFAISIFDRQLNRRHAQSACILPSRPHVRYARYGGIADSIAFFRTRSDNRLQGNCSIEPSKLRPMRLLRRLRRRSKSLCGRVRTFKSNARPPNPLNEGIKMRAFLKDTASHWLRPV